MQLNCSCRAGDSSQLKSHYPPIGYCNYQFHSVNKREKTPRLPFHALREAVLLRSGSACVHVAVTDRCNDFLVLQFDVGVLSSVADEENRHDQTDEQMGAEDEHGSVTEADVVVEDAADRGANECAQGEGARPQAGDEAERF